MVQPDMDRGLAISGIGCALLLGFGLLSLKKHRKRRPYELTTWTYAVCITYLLAWPILSAGSRSNFGILAASMASYVAVARFLLLPIQDSKHLHTGVTDVVTHVAAPLAAVIALGATRVPARSLPAAMGLAAIAICWMGANVSRLHRTGKWVYGRVGNPKTTRGKITTLTSFVIIFLIVMACTHAQNSTVSS